MSFIFLRNRVTGGAAFSPAALFASGEEGAWYEPSTTTAFRSTTDLTPCDYGQSAGLLLDLSKGAGYSGGSFTGLGSELVTNGTFDTDVSGWTATASTTISLSSNAILSTATATAGFYQDLTTVAGAQYVISWDYTAGTSTGVTIRVSDGVLFDGGLVISAASTGAAYFVASSTATRIYFRQADAGTATFDNISVRELPGNHATQGTESARPILARVPETGRRNLLERTEEFDDAYWNKASVTIDPDTSDIADPLGGNTADKATLTNVAHNMRSALGVAVSASTQYTFSFYVYRGTATDLAYSVYDLSNAADIVSSTSYYSDTVSGAWSRVSLTFTTPVGCTSIYPYLLRTSGATGTVYFWGAQLEAGSTATAYQQVVSEYDVTEAGVTSLDYLSFDGSDDSLSVSMSEAAGPVSIFAAAQSDKTTDPQYIIDIETGRLFLGFNATGSNSGIYDGSVFVAASLTITNTTVLSGIARTSAILRANGSQVASGTITQRAIGGAINIGNRFASSTAPLDGRIFGLIIRASDSTAQEISDTESYVANLSGVSI